MNAIYKIKVTNWLEHNPNKKSTYKKTLIANNMIHDARICALPLSHRWLFFGLLLICGDYASDTVTITEQQVNNILTARVGCENALNLLQSYQLLTFEKTLLNKEKKERNKGKKEMNTRVFTKPGEKLPAVAEPNANAFLARYCELFKLRYGTNPVIDGKTAGIAKRVSKTLGHERGNLLLEAFFSIPDAWLHKAKHPLNLFETKLNEVTVFADSGQFTTTAQSRQNDNLASNAMLLRKIEAGEI